MPARNIFFCLLPVALAAIGLAADAPSINRAEAARFFREAEDLSRRDGGDLWGVPLYGPMLLVDPGSREIVANQADPEGRLARRDGVWTGTLPDSENLANTATDWSGARWTMLVWPLPEDRATRAILMVHELFHRVQDDLGLPASNPANAHLDEMAGRLWLRLELEALRAALESGGEEEARHVESALVFRAHRHQLFDGAAAEEGALERNEGLAEYTGVTLSGLGADETRVRLGRKIDGAAALPSLVRSFAYTTGPIYGSLLDRRGSEWRRQIKGEVGLGDLLARQRGLALPEDPEPEAEARLGRYGGVAIREAEAERESQRQERIAGYRRLLVDGPVLAIGLQAMQVQFNPNNLQPLGEHGTVYPTLRISDVWGILEVTGGALLHPSWSRVAVPAADTEAGKGPRRIETGGWTLELAEGWEIVLGERAGDFELRSPPAQ